MGVVAARSEWGDVVVANWVSRAADCIGARDASMWPRVFPSVMSRVCPALQLGAKCVAVTNYLNGDPGNCPYVVPLSVGTELDDRGTSEGEHDEAKGFS